MVGRYTGAKDEPMLRKSVRYLLRWGMIITLLFTVIYYFWGEYILAILTNDRPVIDTAMEYMTWTVLVPITGFSAFLFDGIYIGATASKSMRNIMFVATAAFFIAYYALAPQLGNNGLWIAFLIFLTLRGGLMWLWNGKVIRVWGLVLS